MSATRSEQDYSYNIGFQIWRENQDFGRQNISMSQPPLESTPIGTNTTNRTTSKLESIPIGTKNPDPTQHTQPTESSMRQGKAHVPEKLESDPSSPDSSSRESDFSDDNN